MNHLITTAAIPELFNRIGRWQSVRYRCPKERARAIFRRLNGRKILVRGNHDKVGVRLPWDGPVVDVTRTVVPDPTRGAPLGVFMFHYACRVWPRMHRGDLYFYGHSHGTLQLSWTCTSSSNALPKAPRRRCRASGSSISSITDW